MGPNALEIGLPEMKKLHIFGPSQNYLKKKFFFKYKKVYILYLNIEGCLLYEIFNFFSFLL